MKTRLLPGAPSRRALSCAMLLASAGSVQAASPADRSAEPLEPITVTARQSQENQHDVPLSVTVLDGITLEDRRLRNINQALETMADVTRYDTSDPLYDNFNIRGMGTAGNISMDNDAVALNVNGSTAPNRSFGMMLLDVARIEVLKGPQGTLMGRNSTAGAINVVTNRPIDTFEANARVEAGTHHQYSAEAMVNTPLAQGLNARLAVRHSREHHWVENVLDDGNPVSRPRQLAMRASLQWDVSPATSALLTFDHHRQERFFAQMLMHPYGNTPQTDITPGTYDDNRKRLSRYALEVNHRFSGSQLTSVTALDRDRYDAVSANDRNLMRMQYGIDAEDIMPLQVHNNVVTQDLRLASLPGDRLFWVAGVNYWHSNRTFLSVYPSQQTQQDKRYRTTSHAVYGELTYPVLERLSLTAGLRYTRDRKSFDATYYGPGGSQPDSRRLSDSYLTGRLALSYAFSSTLNTYVSFSRGYRPGGVGDYVAQPDDSVPYQASRVNYLEWGWKFQSADGNASLNAALFHADIKKEQVSTYDPMTYFIRYYNLDARSRGFELSGSLRPHRALRLNASVAYTHAAARQDLLGLMEGDVHKGNRLSDVPNWKATLGVEYLQPLSAFAGMASPALTAGLNLRYVGARMSDIQNNSRLSPYAVVDARLAIAGRQSEVYVYVQNLFDKRYEMYRYALGNGMALGGQQRGRTIGVGYSHTF